MAPVRVLLAIAASMLPVRWWSRLDYLPVQKFACVSGAVTMFAGFAIGIPGFLRYAGLFSQTVLDTVFEVAPSEEIPVVLFGPLAPLNFAFGTPVGLVATYLCVTGALRTMAGWVDDPRGDLVLTLADLAVHRTRIRARAIGARRARERLEGPEAPDRLVTGEWAGVDAEYVLLASRRKPGWEEGVFVITPGQWYRIGRPWDMPLPVGLRTAYPLTELPEGEVLRKGVDYELPELSNTP